MLLALLAAGVAVARVPAAFAANPAVTDLSVELPDELTVGDRVRFVVTVEADEGTVVTLAPGSLPPQLELATLPAARSRSIGSGRVRIELAFEAAPFVPGPIDVPGLRLRYQGRDGASGELVTPPTSLRVESVLARTDDRDLRDLKPQLEIGAAQATAWWPFGVGVAAGVVMLAAAFGLLRRRLRKPVIVPTEPLAALTAEDRARAQLDRAGPDFATTGDYVTYYSALGATVRSYLTERFAFPAFALTTREMQEQMVSEGMDRWQARLVAGLLAQCDAVVFAHYRPAHERADADLTAAYEIVEMTRPAPVLDTEKDMAAV